MNICWLAPVVTVLSVLIFQLYGADGKDLRRHKRYGEDSVKVIEKSTNSSESFNVEYLLNNSMALKALKYGLYIDIFDTRDISDPPKTERVLEIDGSGKVKYLPGWNGKICHRVDTLNKRLMLHIHASPNDSNVRYQIYLKNADESGDLLSTFKLNVGRENPGEKPNENDWTKGFVAGIVPVGILAMVLGGIIYLVDRQKIKCSRPSPLPPSNGITVAPSQSPSQSGNTLDTQGKSETSRSGGIGEQACLIGPDGPAGDDYETDGPADPTTTTGVGTVAKTDVFPPVTKQNPSSIGIGEKMISSAKDIDHNTGKMHDLGSDDRGKSSGTMKQLSVVGSGGTTGTTVAESSVTIELQPAEGNVKYQPQNRTILIVNSEDYEGSANEPPALLSRHSSKDERDEACGKRLEAKEAVSLG